MAHASLVRRFRALRTDPITFETGTYDDLRALSRYHYVAGRPGPIARILRATADGETIGVLAASMPTLNGRWRSIAWPGDYDTPDKRANALRLNHDVRVISRVIVDPRYRGRGVAVRLVRAYLDAPCTERTEALAAMAHACPFFERAGMERIDLPPSKADAKLLRAMARHGVEPADLLASLPAAITPSLRAWARARKLRGGDIAARAFALLTHPPVAHVHKRSQP